MHMQAARRVLGSLAKRDVPLQISVWRPDPDPDCLSMLPLFFACGLPCHCDIMPMKRGANWGSPGPSLPWLQVSLASLTLTRVPASYCWLASCQIRDSTVISSITHTHALHPLHS